MLWIITKVLIPGVCVILIFLDPRCPNGMSNNSIFPTDPNMLGISITFASWASFASLPIRPILRLLSSDLFCYCALLIPCSIHQPSDFLLLYTIPQRQLLQCRLLKVYSHRHRETDLVGMSFPPHLLGLDREVWGAQTVPNLKRAASSKFLDCDAVVE